MFNRRHGGKIKEMKKTLRKKLEKERADVFILQAGGNDLHDATSPLALANDIIGAGKIAAEYCSEVAISSILPRADFHLNLARWETNILLRGLCSSNNFTFIEHDITVKKHLLKDGVHLNQTGTDLFSENLFDCLHDLSILSC